MEFQRGHEYSGYFFTFEGGEGVGKSKQIELLADQLRSQGNSVLVLREPGGTAVGEQIRHTLQYSKQSVDMCPGAELMLFEASRAQLVHEIIKPALSKGGIVLSDRFYDSSTAYQGAGRKLDSVAVNFMNWFATGGLKPDLTFLIDLDPRVGMARAKGRELFDRMEAQTLDFYDRVRREFDKIAYDDPLRVKKIDGAQSIEEIHREIVGYVSDFMSNTPEYAPG
jgi:dTMP kinase